MTYNPCCIRCCLNREFIADTPSLGFGRIIGNLALLKQLQGFLLEAAKSLPNISTTFWSLSTFPKPRDRYPPLETFVVDAIRLLEILQWPNPLSEHEEIDPMDQLYDLRWQSWWNRWIYPPGMELKDTKELLENSWREYSCGLCNVLFGRWSEDSPIYSPFGLECDIFAPIRLRGSCLASELSFYNPNSAISRNYQYLDYHIFDSGYIESCGPFRFHPTDNLSLHLTITKNNEILFYADWKKWVLLARHKVLHEAAKQNQSGRKVGFDTLISTTRLKPEVMGYSPAFLRIAQDVLIMNLLCFRQPALLISQGKSRDPSFISKMLNRIRGKQPSSGIGDRIGLKLSDGEAEEYVAMFGLHSEDWSSLLDYCLPFQEREIQLYNMLKDWKPNTIWEMRYLGYGGVDPVGLYAFYFALAVGLVAIFGLGISIAQTYAGFRALQCPSDQVS